MKIVYTICFLHNEHDEVLMLFREKSPNQGKWNGLGGKIEEGESLLKSCLRELKEESGLDARDLQYKGIVSWNQMGGMHVFIGTEFSGDIQATDEGKVEWKSLDWVLHSSEVVSNIPYFIQQVLFDPEPYEHAFSYNQEGHINEYVINPIKKEKNQLIEK